MTLEESKELLKEMKESAMYLRLYHDKKAQLKVEAIDTVLKALEDSIPKEKVRMVLGKMEQYKKECDTNLFEQGERSGYDSAIYWLRNILGE